MFPMCVMQVVQSFMDSADSDTATANMLQVRLYTLCTYVCKHGEEDVILHMQGEVSMARKSYEKALSWYIYKFCPKFLVYIRSTLCVNRAFSIYGVV